MNEDPLLIVDIVMISTSTVLLLAYHLFLLLAINCFWKTTKRTYIGLNNTVRKKWVSHMMQEKSNSILVIQALRNTTSVAAVLASTSIILGLAFLSYSVSNATIAKYTYLGSSNANLIFVKFLILFACMLSAFFNFMLAIRSINHATFMMMLPKAAHLEDIEETPAHYALEKLSTHTLNKGYLYYTFGMRSYYLAIPHVFWVFSPVGLIVGTIALVLMWVYIDFVWVKKTVDVIKGVNKST